MGPPLYRLVDNRNVRPFIHGEYRRCIIAHSTLSLLHLHPLAVESPVCHLQCTCAAFFFKDTATTEIYSFSLHDAFPIPVRTVPPSFFKHNAIRIGKSQTLASSSTLSAFRFRRT